MIKDKNIFSSFKYSFYFLFLTLFLGFVLNKYAYEHINSNKEFYSIFFDLSYKVNTGFAFSIFNDFKEFVIYLNLFIFTTLFIYFVIKIKDYFNLFIPLLFIFIGGFSNLVDRIVLGGVVDYLNFKFLSSFATFNVADILINIGIGLFLVIILFKGPNNNSV